jgi:hypothetical protein
MAWNQIDCLVSILGEMVLQAAKARLFSGLVLTGVTDKPCVLHSFDAKADLEVNRERRT